MLKVVQKYRVYNAKGYVEYRTEGEALEVSDEYELIEATYTVDDEPIED